MSAEMKYSNSLLSLTLVSLVMMLNTAQKTITMIDSSGNEFQLTSSAVFITLGIGWAAFCLSVILNILYYALHPSQVCQCRLW